MESQTLRSLGIETLLSGASCSAAVVPGTSPSRASDLARSALRHHLRLFSSLPGPDRAALLRMTCRIESREGFWTPLRIHQRGASILALQARTIFYSSTSRLRMFVIVTPARGRSIARYGLYPFPTLGLLPRHRHWRQDEPPSGGCLDQSA